MSLLNNLATEALSHQPTLSELRVVVEKELLHHDILRILSENHLLADLTFIGGTALRACYGGIRLSEDLDFTGGSNFSKEKLSSLGNILTDSLHQKYDLQVEVSQPIKETGNVTTWKIKIITHPKQKNLPMQRINIDICSVPSYEKKPMLLINPYGVEMGTSGLIINTQSREEIYVDKLLAFALRPNKIKYRDLWDISWLHQQSITPHLELLPHKLQDRGLRATQLQDFFVARTQSLSSDVQHMTAFQKEMQRFLPQTMIPHVTNPDFWSFLIDLMSQFKEKIKIRTFF